MKNIFSLFITLTFLSCSALVYAIVPTGTALPPQGANMQQNMQMKSMQGNEVRQQQWQKKHQMMEQRREQIQQQKKLMRERHEQMREHKEMMMQRHQELKEQHQNMKPANIQQRPVKMTTRQMEHQ